MRACCVCMYAGVYALCMREDHSYIIIGLKQSVNDFSAKFSFSYRNASFRPQKFSATW